VCVLRGEAAAQECRPAATADAGWPPLVIGCAVRQRRGAHVHASPSLTAAPRPRPALRPRQLAAYLDSLIDQGYTIYVVRGNLPNPQQPSLQSGDAAEGAGTERRWYTPDEVRGWQVGAPSAGAHCELLRRATKGCTSRTRGAAPSALAPKGAPADTRVRPAPPCSAPPPCPPNRPGSSTRTPRPRARCGGTVGCARAAARAAAS
jgi:hypothetical protein